MITRSEDPLQQRQKKYFVIVTHKKVFLVQSLAIYKIKINRHNGDQQLHIQSINQSINVTNRRQSLNGSNYNRPVMPTTLKEVGKESKAAQE
jgi:hypothetical protein